MTFNSFTLSNTPPRTTVHKTLYLACNTSDGNLQLNLSGGWTEYKPEEVQSIMAAMQEWLDALIFWTCPSCGSDRNATLGERAGDGKFGYAWVRCRDCKKKIKRTVLGFTN